MKSILLPLFLLIGYAGIAQDFCSLVQAETPDFEVATTNDIEYGTFEKNGVTNTLALDFYRPDTTFTEPLPLIILAHGGSFVSGTRGDMQEICELYTRRGFATASISYRLHNIFTDGIDTLSFIKTVAGAVQDMKSSIRFFYKDAQEQNFYNIDTNAIFIGGGSAGGILALHTAFLDSTDVNTTVLDTIYQELGGLEMSSGNNGFNDDVQGVINLSGGLLDLDFVDAGEDIPVISFHGTADEVVFYEVGRANNILRLFGSGRIHPKLNEAGIENVLVPVEGGGHTDIYFAEEFETERDSFFALSINFVRNTICAAGTPTSIDIVLNQTDVFPNPNQGIINLQSDYPLKAFQLYDVQGKQVFYSDLSLAQSNLVLPANLQNGFYIASVTTSKGLETHKILLQR